MAAVQVIPTVPAQTRTGQRTWSTPPSSGLTYARPWRSSPLAGPGFSTLPPIFAGSSEESLASPEPVRQFAQSRSHSSSSIGSQGSLSASPYASRNPSGLLLDEGDASTSSVSPAPSTSAHGATSSSHGHSSSQSHSLRPARLSKSWGRPKSMVAAQEDSDARPKNVTKTFVTPPPRARTVSHGHSRPASFPVVPVAATPTMPPTYSRTSQPHPDSNKPPSTSRDPSANWVSSSPFGPAMTPKFSRLAMASPAVVMPLSAKEYRKQKARESVGKGKEKEPPSSSNHVTFADIDIASSAKTPNGVPLVTVSPPPSENVDQPPPPPSPDAPSDHRIPPQQQVDKQQPHAALSAPPLPRSSSQNHPRSRSRPTTPPRSSPLATHPPISPKSSTGTFYSLAPASDDEVPRSHGTDDPNPTNDVPPARPRPRPRRRKSYPDRLSNGARLSFIEAMNRLSQGSVLSQTDDKNGDNANRLSTVSQASGRTLFYDAEEPNNPRVDLKKRPSATQSLENLSSTLARAGGEIAHDSSDETPRAAKRNVRMVRISDTVQVSPSPVQRRRKLTKSRPVSVQPQVPTQAPERRTSLLPWKSKRVEEHKAATTAGVADKDEITKFVGEATSSTHSLGPVVNIEPHSKSESDHTLCEPPTPTAATPEPDPRKTRRSTFSFLSSPTFRPKREREKSHTLFASVDVSKTVSNQHPPANVTVKPKEIARTLESGTDSTSTSIYTIAQSQTTLSGSATPPVYDLTTLASSSGLSVVGLDTSSSAVPILCQLNAQALGIPDEPLQNPWDTRDSSTPSLITTGSAVTLSSSTPRTLTAASFVCLPPSGLEPFVPRPSALKGSFTDTSEEEDRVHLRVSRHPGCPGARAGSRPGSSSSTATETETSGSYISLSTMPASSQSGSGSTSRSASPVERRDRLAQGGKEGSCSLCGHVVGRTTSPPPTYAPSMHPMFTVPLVTVSATAVYDNVGGGSRDTANKGVPRDLMVPVYGHVSETVVKHTRDRYDQEKGHVHGRHVNGVVPIGRAKTMASPTLTLTSNASVSPPPRVRKRRRPLTAPDGSKDAPPSRFVEERKGMVGVSMDNDLVGPGRMAKAKGESKLKTVLKGLLKWG